MQWLTRTLTIASALAFCCSSYGQLPQSVDELPFPDEKDRFPISHSAEDFERLASDNSYDGKYAALEGVLEKSIPNDGNSILKIRLSPERAIWVHQPGELSSDFIAHGFTFRVMGWLRDLDTVSSKNSLPPETQHSPILQSICVVQSASLIGAFDSKYKKHCEAWMKGFELNDLSR